jgi:hypothetical protein
MYHNDSFMAFSGYACGGVDPFASILQTRLVVGPFDFGFSRQRQLFVQRKLLSRVGEWPYA